MRLCGVAIAVTAILAPSLTYGADLEVFKAEQPTIYVQNQFLWGGVYVGGFLGGGWGTANWGASSIVVNTPSGSAVDVASLPVLHVNVPISGFLGGGRVGANYQTGPFVFGFEGDFTGMVLKGHTSTTFSVTDKASGVTFTGTSAHRTTADWATTFTGRFGYTFDRVLAYGKVGVAVEQDGDTIVSIATPIPSGTATTVSGAGTATRYGWTAGAGFEYAFDKHWSGFVEYDHLGFLSQLVNMNPQAVPPLPSFLPFGITVTTTRNIQLNIDRVIAGANYRF